MRISAFSTVFIATGFIVFMQLFTDSNASVLKDSAVKGASTGSFSLDLAPKVAIELSEVCSIAPVLSLAAQSTGEFVVVLKARLTSLGFIVITLFNDQFDTITDSQVRAFQASRGLTIDGIVGPNTWVALCQF